MLTTEDRIQLDKNQSQGSILAFISLLVGVFILSFAAIFTRLSENELSPIATSFNRCFIAFIVLFLWDSFQCIEIGGLAKTKENIEFQDWVRLFLSSVVGTANLFCWAYSLTQTNVANSNLLHNLTPVFVVLGGWLFLSQRFEPRLLLGMGLAIIGSTTIGWGDFKTDRHFLAGDFWALLSAVFYAANYLIREKLRSKFSAITILLWPCLFSACFTLIITLFLENQVFPKTWQTWVSVMGLGIFCQVIGQGLLTHSLKDFSSSFVTILMLLEPFLTALFAWVIFAEPLSPLNWVALILTLAGIYLTKQRKGSEKPVDLAKAQELGSINCENEIATKHSAVDEESADKVQGCGDLS
jgi:drug/metabolite transporter (DMT)-like permease